MPESVFMGQLHLSKACWELWLSDDQPHSDYYGQWQRAPCMLAVLQSSQPNPQRNEKKREMYAIKQIKICAEYRDMLPRPRLDLSGTPGLRPIGLSPGSWQTSLNKAQPNHDHIISDKLHNDVIKWKHFLRHWPILREIHRSPVNSRHKGQWRGTSMFLWSAPE